MTQNTHIFKHFYDYYSFFESELAIVLGTMGLVNMICHQAMITKVIMALMHSIGKESQTIKGCVCV